MRYQRGSIALHEFRDRAMLSVVADSRYVTHSQLYEFARLNYWEFNRRVFNWRVRRLVRGGLVRKQVLPFLDGEPLYSISRAGIHALEQLGTYYLGANFEREKDASEAQVPHVLEVTNIRLALLRANATAGWIPEPIIRVLNLSPVLGYAKVYDGIGIVDIEGRSVRFAVEYERTMKSVAKYEKIRDVIESENRLNVFVYLVPAVELLLSLTREFHGTKRFVLFAYLDEFKRNVLDTATRTPEYFTVPLRKVLAAVAARESTSGGIVLRDGRQII